jgi:hypothetical protein
VHDYLFLRWHGWLWENINSVEVHLIVLVFLEHLVGIQGYQLSFIRTNSIPCSHWPPWWYCPTRSSVAESSHFTHLHETVRIWLFDPSKPNGKHITLAIVAAFIIIIAAVLLFSKCLVVSRSSYLNIFMEAFTVPLKANNHYWVGLLFLTKKLWKKKRIHLTCNILQHCSHAVITVPIVSLDTYLMGLVPTQVQQLVPLLQCYMAHKQYTTVLERVIACMGTSPPIRYVASETSSCRPSYMSLITVTAWSSKYTDSKSTPSLPLFQTRWDVLLMPRGWVYLPSLCSTPGASDGDRLYVKNRLNLLYQLPN